MRNRTLIVISQAAKRNGGNVVMTARNGGTLDEGSEGEGDWVDIDRRLNLNQSSYNRKKWMIKLAWRQLAKNFVK